MPMLSLFPLTVIGTLTFPYLLSTTCQSLRLNALQLFPYKPVDSCLQGMAQLWYAGIGLSSHFK